MPRVARSAEVQRAGTGKGLRDVILGGQDGLVNVLGSALGLSATTGDIHIILTAGLAAPGVGVLVSQLFHTTDG